MEKPCDRNEIGLQLQAAAEGIDKANCEEIKVLQGALKELSELLLKKDASQNDSESASSSATQNVNAVPAHATTQSVNAAPADAPAPAPAPAKYELDQGLVFKTVTGEQISLERIMNMLQNKKCKLDGPKCVAVLNNIKNANSEDEIREIIGELNIYQNSIDSKSGGTRKRKTTQRKRAKTLKNKKKVGKRK